MTSAKKKAGCVEMEPEFTRAVSSRFVCNYLYFYFMLTIAVAALSVVGAGAAAFAVKGSLLTKLFLILPNLLVAALAVLTGLSLYVICERGLRPEESNKGGHSAEGYRSR